MINNLAIDQETGDLLEKNSQIMQVTELDAVAQGIASDLRTFLGEYWLNTSIGIPYYIVVFRKDTDISLIKTLLKNEIQKRNDVIEVTRFTFNFINFYRQAIIVFSAKTTSGEIVNQEIVI